MRRQSDARIASQRALSGDSGRLLSGRRRWLKLVLLSRVREPDVCDLLLEDHALICYHLQEYTFFVCLRWRRNRRH